MTTHARIAGWTLLVAVALLAPPASAFDSSLTFAKGTYVISAEGSYGEQFNLEDLARQSDIKFWNAGFRASILPFGPTGASFLHGAFEAGLEALYQRYTEPAPAFWAGLAVALRYHFLSLGHVVPYVRPAAAPAEPT